MSCYCCLRRASPVCTCQKELCRRCLHCVSHCRCLVKPLAVQQPPQPHPGLFDEPILVLPINA
jgi:hypothetical protein